MPRMIGYMAGDADTYAIRRSQRKPFQVVLDVSDINRMLVLRVEHTGQILMGWTPSVGGQAVRELDYVGHIHHMDPKSIGVPWLEWFTNPTPHTFDEPVLSFTELGSVPEDDDDDDE